MVHRTFQTTKERGVGLELCYTPPIVELDGGNIRIDSQLNCGSTVEAEFPRI